VTLDQETYAVLVPSFAWFDYATAYALVTEAERERKRQWAADNRAHRQTPNAPCAGCGRVFVNRRKGWIRKFCTDDCRAKHHDRLRKAARRKPAPATCACGAVLRHGEGHKPRKWCSEKCRKRGVKSRAGALAAPPLNEVEATRG